MAKPVFRALSVDDDSMNLRLIEEMSRNIGLTVASFTDPIKALESGLAEQYDLAFVDYMMPGLNGVDFIKKLSLKWPDMPVVMITAVAGDEALKIEALQAGATEFLNKPLNSADFTARVRNLLTLRESQLLLRDRALLLEHEVDLATDEIVQREYEALDLIGKAAEYRDPETGAHLKRVARYSRLMGKALGLDRESLDLLFYSSPLHDVGKMGIPDNILLKPARLSSGEFEIMKTHTTIGSDILKQKKSKYIQAGAVIAMDHHERYNGTGYPRGIRGEEIHIYGRVVSVVDVFDALCSRRPYKNPWSFEDARAYIINGRGAQFDPAVVDSFVDSINEVREIYDTVREEGEEGAPFHVG